MSTSAYFIADESFSSSYSPSDSSQSFMDIEGTTFRIATLRTPSSSTSNGIAGEICIGKTTLLGIDTYWLYYCYANDHWVRQAFAGF